MTAVELTHGALMPLAAAGREHDLTIVLGAGASAPSGLPSWNEFVERILVDTRVVETPALAAKLLKGHDPQILLEAARAAASEWEESLVTALYPPENKPTPSSLHLAAAGHFIVAPERTTLATLNYDILLEQALLNSTSSTSSVSILTDAELDPGSPSVHHLHGVITPDFSYEPIVSFADYARLVSSDDPWQRLFLNDALERGALLLMGTSYRDPDIRQWLHHIVNERQSAHPAIVLVVREALGLSHDEFDQAERALRGVWESIGLTALTTHSFVDAAQILREIAHLHHPKYAAPSDRADRLWIAHAQRFAPLQREYATELDSARATMQRALGTKVPQATLWLARSDGTICRWASHDRHYRSVEDLHHITSGHDSKWLAGKALGTERQILDNVHAAPHDTTRRRRSVLAVPVFVNDKSHPAFAGAVLTFGLSAPAEEYAASQDDWAKVADELAGTWGTRLSAHAFES